MSALTVRQVRRSATCCCYGLRWLPTGLMIPVHDPADAGARAVPAADRAGRTAQGLVVLALELPTGGLADALGRNRCCSPPGCSTCVSLALFAVADSFALFFAGLGAAGHLPGAGQRPAGVLVRRRAPWPPTRRPSYERGLGHAGAVIGVAIAAGALLSGGLVALGPVGPVSALTVPVLAAIGAAGGRRWSRCWCCWSRCGPASGVAALRASVRRGAPDDRPGVRAAAPLPGAAGAGRGRAVLGLRHGHLRVAAAGTARRGGRRHRTGPPRCSARPAPRPGSPRPPARR